MKGTETEPKSSGRPLSSSDIHRLRTYVRRRKAFYDMVQRALAGIKSFDQLFVIVIALLIGTSAGYIAAGFRSLISLFQTNLWGPGALVDAVRSVPWYFRLLIPAVGGVIVALFVNRYAPEAKGHGVPEVMDAVATRNGFIRMRVVLVKALASALSIGSGGSVGREGPIVQVGSAFGSTIGQIFQVSARRMKTFVGCGAAAGIAATFNAPVAGAIFASEIILGDFSVSSIAPIMIASVMGTVISHSIYGDYPSFVPPLYELQTPIELVFYAILGIAAGLVGWAFVRTLYYSEDLFDNLKLPLGAKALLGGIILGSIALMAPEILGVGYETMDRVLAGNIPLLVGGTLLVAKILATTVTLGSGGSGGIFAPSLFMGSMLGGTLGQIFHGMFPNITASSGAYALVGMAAVVAATTHAPITAIVIIFEMTTEYSVILPLIISSIIATVITTRMLEGSIYTIKLQRRGVNIHGGTDVNVLKQLSVNQIKRQMVETIDESAPVEELLTRMSNSEQLVFYSCDTQGRLTGIITQSAIRRFLNRFEEIPAGTTVADLANTHFTAITDNTPVQEALRLMSELDTDTLPVLDEAGRVTGHVVRADIIREYQELLIQLQSAGALASSMKYVHRYFHEKLEVIPGFLLARINVPSTFVNNTVHDLNLRKKYNVDVLLIRHKTEDGYEDLLPEPSVQMGSQDQLLIFGRREDVETVCNLS
jgi:CIC family chloride channel protein